MSGNFKCCMCGKKFKNTDLIKKHYKKSVLCRSWHKHKLNMRKNFSYRKFFKTTYWLYPYINAPEKNHAKKTI